MVGTDISASGNMNIGSGSEGGNYRGAGCLQVFNDANVSVSDVNWSLKTHNIYVYNKSRTGTGGQGYGGSIGFGGNDTTNNHLRPQAAIAIKNTGADSRQNGLAFFTHAAASVSTPNVESMVLTHDGTLILDGTDGGGHVSASGDVIAYYSSDERLKYNIRTIENPIEKVSRLRGVQYQWNDNQTAYSPGSNDTGIIAQDVQKVLPEIVTQRKDGHLAVKHDRLVGLLIESVKEQQKQINELKDEVKKLKGDI